MKAKAVNRDNVYAKILALSSIYEKEESRRRVFLEKITYTPGEMKAVINTVSDDVEFRSWIETAIPVMQCRKKLKNWTIFPNFGQICATYIKWRKTVQIWRSFDLYTTKIPRTFVPNLNRNF